MMHDDIDISKKNEDSARTAIICSTVFLCIVLLFDSISFFIGYFITQYGKLTLASPEAISAYIDIAIVAGFIFGLAPFSFTRFKALAAAGFFIFCQYSATGYFDGVCALQLALGAGLGLLTVKFPTGITVILGLSVLAVSIILNSLIYLH